jgi:hypothetical protein
VLPIPGTDFPDHLRENVKGAPIKSSTDDLLAVEDAAGQPS